MPHLHRVIRRKEKGDRQQATPTGPSAPLKSQHGRRRHIPTVSMKRFPLFLAGYIHTHTHIHTYTHMGCMSVKGVHKKETKENIFVSRSHFNTRCVYMCVCMCVCIYIQRTGDESGDSDIPAIPRHEAATIEATTKS